MVSKPFKVSIVIDVQNHLDQHVSHLRADMPVFTQHMYSSSDSIQLKELIRQSSNFEDKCCTATSETTGKTDA